jgi:polysaccharide deacetylase family protein (PEP-CTERM system associated)
VPVLNALTVDVEGFVESNRESFAIPARYQDPARESREIRVNTDATLALFAELGVRGTFFVVGRIARDLPDVVRAIAAAGHEVGCHNFEHRRISGLTPAVLRAGLARALSDLGDLAGASVLGFRAPDFSITRHSLWALDILRELGLAYDSSIYPIAGHDVYGIPEWSPRIQRLPNGLVELPLSTFPLLGRRLPFGGGGYFRLYPLAMTRLLVDRVNRVEQPAMFYIHPYEVGPEIPRIVELPAVRRFRHYLRCGRRDRIVRLLHGRRFGPVRDVLKECGFS